MDTSLSKGCGLWTRLCDLAHLKAAQSMSGSSAEAQPIGLKPVLNWTNVTFAQLRTGLRANERRIIHDSALARAVSQHTDTSNSIKATLKYCNAL